MDPEQQIIAALELIQGAWEQYDARRDQESLKKANLLFEVQGKLESIVYPEK